MKYALRLNGETICEISLESPDWLPIRPRLQFGWLRGLVAQALRSALKR